MILFKIVCSICLLIVSSLMIGGVFQLSKPASYQVKYISITLEKHRFELTSHYVHYVEITFGIVGKVQHNKEIIYQISSNKNLDRFIPDSQEKREFTVKKYLHTYVENFNVDQIRLPEIEGQFNFNNLTNVNVRLSDNYIQTKIMEKKGELPDRLGQYYGGLIMCFVLIYLVNIIIFIFVYNEQPYDMMDGIIEYNIVIIAIMIIVYIMTIVAIVNDPWHINQNQIVTFTSLGSFNDPFIRGVTLDNNVFTMPYNVDLRQFYLDNIYNGYFMVEKNIFLEYEFVNKWFLADEPNYATGNSVTIFYVIAFIFSFPFIVANFIWNLDLVVCGTTYRSIESVLNGVCFCFVMTIIIIEMIWGAINIGTGLSNNNSYGLGGLASGPICLIVFFINYGIFYCYSKGEARISVSDNSNNRSVENNEENVTQQVTPKPNLFVHDVVMPEVVVHQATPRPEPFIVVHQATSASESVVPIMVPKSVLMSKSAASSASAHPATQVPLSTSVPPTAPIPPLATMPPPASVPPPTIVTDDAIDYASHLTDIRFFM